MSRFRILIGLVISVVLLYFTFRGLDWAQVGLALRDANYVYIALASVVILLAFVVRAMRWSWLMRPVRYLPWQGLFSVVLIGFFGNYVLPAKTGELVRAYVLGKREDMSKSAIMGSIAVEKTMDTLILFVILLATLWAVPLPPEVANIEPIAGIFLVIVIGGMLLLAARGRHASNLIVRVLQFAFPWWKERVARITNSFVDGLAVLYHRSSIIMVLRNALGLEIPLYGYVMIVAVTNMASFIPSLPGRFGTLELFSVFVLGLFGVDKNTAVLFPILLRVAQLVPILLGYLFLNREGVKILDVTRSNAAARAAEKKSEAADLATPMQRTVTPK
jgi:uncharacterized membrane protein YbhN (UPF0104 family)